MPKTNARRVGICCVLATAIVTGFVGSADAATQALRVSGNHRFLVRDDGTPFFWLGDTNWRMYKMSQADINSYLTRRAGQGFNVIQGPVLLSSQAGSEFRNSSGEFNNNPSNPNERWFEQIDQIVDAADERGMYMALVAVWGDDWNIFGSTAAAREYGRYLGHRYADRRNVIWIVAGEYVVAGDSSAIINTWKNLGLGLREGSAGNNLITIHGSFQPGRQSSSAFLHQADWLDFNMIQSSQSGNDGSGADNWKLVATDYKRSPIKPVIDGEANYEKINGWDAFGVRRRAFWSVFAGAFGHTYGAHGMWGSYQPGDDPADYSSADPWRTAVKYPGGADMKYLRRLMESRPMLDRVPDQKMVLGSMGNLPDHIQATRDRFGRYAMIYVPQTGRTFTVMTSRLNGSRLKAWWFDPRNGKVKSAGEFSRTSSHDFKTPTSGQDWVLVLDDTARGYPKPGSGGPLQ